MDIETDSIISDSIEAQVNNQDQTSSPYAPKLSAIGRGLDRGPHQRKEDYIAPDSSEMRALKSEIIRARTTIYQESVKDQP
jgi:hypothetical protein